MDPLHPTDPSHIGGYPLTGRLGTGGMGQVYLARTPSRRQIVIKVIRPEFASEEGFRARFAREAENARKVGGFHTAQVIDAAPDADAPWIATAHIPGPTLAQTVRENGPVTPPALYILVTGLAEGLDAIHKNGLVHRDLKPGNIILADDGPRIIDFGIARPLEADSITTRGAVFGTLPYMSPEQTDGNRVGPASDVFSLGTVLAYAATGTNPFQGSTMAETLRKIISPAPDPGRIDSITRELIADCWTHDPDQRPSPAQILTRFQALDLDGSWPPPTDRRPEPAAGPFSAAPDASAPVPPTKPVPLAPAAPDPPVPEQATPAPKAARSATRPTDPPRLPKIQPSLPATKAKTTPPAAFPQADSTVRKPGQKKRAYYYISAAAVALVVVLALLTWESPLPSEDSTDSGTTTPSDSDTGEGSDEAAAPIPTDDELCTPNDVIVTFDFAEQAREAYEAEQDPRFRITMVNTGDSTCTVEVGAEAMEVRIHSGNEQIFSTADCTEENSTNEQQLSRGVPYEHTFTWEREHSFTDCRGTPSAPPGWYRANLYGDYTGDNRELVFQLEG